VQNSQQIFKLHSEYKPTGDQPQAIEKLVVFCGMWVVEHPDVVEAIVVRA
jgi:uvrb: excinuclease ABC subunit B